MRVTHDEVEREIARVKSTCLSCGTPLKSPKIAGCLCYRCSANMTPGEINGYRRAYVFFVYWASRKRLMRRFYRAPDPWMIFLLRLGRVMLGFETAIGMEEGDRQSLDMLSGVDADKIRDMMLGIAPVSDRIKRFLIHHGVRTFNKWNK